MLRRSASAEMDSPNQIVLLMALLLPICFGAGYFLVRAARRAYFRRVLGGRWVGRHSRGRETWILVSREGMSVERVWKTSGGVWATEWGREFSSLTEAARWVESKHVSTRKPDQA